MSSQSWETYVKAMVPSANLDNVAWPELVESEVLPMWKADYVPMKGGTGKTGKRKKAECADGADAEAAEAGTSSGSKRKSKKKRGANQADKAD
eukprot:4911684-Amphidinium_carterae.1